MAPAAPNHNRVSGNIDSIFRRYLRERTCEYFPETGVFLAQGMEEYVPDGVVVCNPEQVKEDGIYGPPDLVVEILSPSTAKYDRGHKKDVYESAGVREYWIVDPVHKSVEQYLLEEGRFRLADTYTILPEILLRRMKPEEREAHAAEFHCSLYDDLCIKLEDIFARVP